MKTNILSLHSLKFSPSMKFRWTSRQASLLLNLLLLFAASCNSVEPPPPGEKATLTLKLEDVSCTETWIELTTTNLLTEGEPPTAIILKQNDVVRDTINLNNADTLLYVDSLLPNTNYTFQAAGLRSPASDVQSNSLNVTTMDTTSHDFTFESYTFGGTAGSSTLYDCAIISPQNIWCVGEIYVADTSQNGYTMYNAVHWDGNEWELERIMFYTICGQQSRIAYPASSLFAFSENDIWIAMEGDQIARLENNVQTETRCLPWSFTITKIWGTSNEDLYVVGNNGNIVHYNGTLWTKIESGTDVSINDVFGIIDQFSNQKKVFCAVSNVFGGGEHKILTIDENNKIDSLNWNLNRRIASVWSSNGWIVYTSGGGVFNNKSGNWVEETIPLNYTNMIRGNGLNEIFVAGDFGLLAHFNGASWKVYEEFQQLPAAALYSITVKDNMLTAVGFSEEKALVVLGRRNKR